MKIFYWYDVSGVTADYHDEAGVVIIASSLDRAITLFREGCENGYQGTDEDLRTSVLTLDAHVETRLIFPNAGCC